ncbi:hypothetical protein ElyMa_001922300, partial [Elysia marginata]
MGFFGQARAYKNTPGVGSYNIANNKKLDAEKGQRLQKLNQSTAHLKDKGLVANMRGELPKHVEDLHQRLKASEEKIIDLDILKMGADKERDILQKEIGMLKEQLKKSTDEVSVLKTQQCAQVAVLSEQLQQEKARFNSMITEMYGKTLALEELKKEKQAMEKELSHLKHRDRSLKESVHRLRELCVHRGGELDNSLISSSSDDEDKVLAWIVEISSTFQEFLNERRSVEEELPHLKSKIATLEADTGTLSTQLESAYLKLSQVKEKHKEEVEKLCEDVRLKDRQMEEMNSQMEEKLSALQANYTTALTDKEQLKNKLESVCLELSEVKEKHKEEVQKLCEDVRLKDRQMEEMNSQMEEKLSALQANLESAYNGNEDLRDKLE